MQGEYERIRTVFTTAYSAKNMGYYCMDNICATIDISGAIHYI